MTDTDNPLIGAFRELGSSSSLLTRAARAKAYLRLLSPQKLRWTLEASRDLQGLIEDVALEQLGTWSEEEIEKMQDRAQDRMLRKEDQ